MVRWATARETMIAPVLRVRVSGPAHREELVAGGYPRWV